MKKIIFILILLTLFLIPSIYAESSKINQLNLNFDNGKIKLLDKTQTIGYYPDRLIQPETGYSLIVFSENQKLYSFKFIPPYTEHTDYWEDNKNLGGVDIRKKFDFSLIVPSYDNEKKIIIYDEFFKEQETIDLTEKSNLLVFSSIGVLIMIILFLILNKKIKLKLH